MLNKNVDFHFLKYKIFLWNILFFLELFDSLDGESVHIDLLSYFSEGSFS